MRKDVHIVLVDDHSLLRNGLANLVTGLGYAVDYESSNGRELQQSLAASALPDLVLMDINMPEMDGFETTLWLKENYPKVKVLALSMYDDETSIIRMIKNGACGFILKDATPEELGMAIDSVMSKGFYYSELVSGRLIHTIRNNDQDNDTNHSLKLSKREIEFLKYVCSELTYKEIAERLHVSPRTVDGYREDLFERLGVKSRIGLALFAIKTKVVLV